MSQQGITVDSASQAGLLYPLGLLRRAQANPCGIAAQGWRPTSSCKCRVSFTNTELSCYGAVRTVTCHRFQACRFLSFSDQRPIRCLGG